MFTFAILFLSSLMMFQMFFSEIYNQTLHTVFYDYKCQPTKFLSVLFAIRNFYGHETDPPRIFQRFQSGYILPLSFAFKVEITKMLHSKLK